LTTVGCVIHACALSRTFKTRTGSVQAVDQLDLDVEAGQIVGLLGPNGAGKTTILRMLTTLLVPTGGDATVAGADLRREPREVRRRIGYVAQIGSAPAPGTRLGEELIDQARLQGLTKADAVDRLADLAPRLDLAGLEGRSLSELSGGQRRRFDVALGLMHQPAVVFLDEPTTGLDPQARANLWTHITSLRDDHGVTVVLTTHYLEEADALAERIVVMDDGLVVADDTPDHLKRLVGGDVVTLRIDGDPQLAAKVIREAVPIRDLHTTEPDTVVVTADDGGALVAPILRALDRSSIALQSVNTSRPTLDDVFLTLTGRSLREDAA
jgi:ABC-2 type transport system ATP-binding protein